MSSFYSRAVPLVAAAALATAPACKRGNDAEATQSKTSATAASSRVATHHRSVRSGLKTWRALLSEAGRAELDAGGLFIDLGTPDQNKYTRGGWRSGWGDPGVTKAGITYAPLTARTGRLDIALRKAPVKQIVLRARSQVAGQHIIVYAEQKAIGGADIGSSWQEVTIPVQAPLPAGTTYLLVALTKKAKSGPRGEVDWMWLRSDTTRKPPTTLPRVLPVRLAAGPKRALPAPTARTYSFYMHIPKHAYLVFDYGADKPTTQFTVRATPVAGGPAATLFSKKALPGSWSGAKVDLGKLAGEAVRLDLVTAGPNAVAGWGEPAIMVKPDRDAKVASASGRPPRNAILILEDTARADSFAPFAPHNKVKTPTYDAFAKDSTVFVHAHDDDNWTKPSVATILSGLYPSTHDTRTETARLPQGVKLISQRLKDAGFSTAGFVANGFISGRFGFDKGWDKFVNYIHQERKSNAKEVFHDALAWVTKHKDQKFFLYIQTIDPHVPYRYYKKYTDQYYQGHYTGKIGKMLGGHEQARISSGRVKASAKDYKWIRAMYHGEISYHDHYLGNFLDAIKKLGLDDNTLIVITNDHGEELDDHGRLGHGQTLYEEILRAPLLFHYPPLFPPGKKVEEITETVDITPTILDALGVPGEDMDGLSLLPLLRGHPRLRPFYAISEFLQGHRSVVVGHWKLIRGAGTSMELYNLDKDPGEHDNLSAKDPLARRLCDVYLGEGLASPNKSQRMQNTTARRHFKSRKAHIDPKLRKQLEALGYLSD